MLEFKVRPAGVISSSIRACCGAKMVSKHPIKSTFLGLTLTSSFYAYMMVLCM